MVAKRQHVGEALGAPLEVVDARHDVDDGLRGQARHGAADVHSTGDPAPYDLGDRGLGANLSQVAARMFPMGTDDLFTLKSGRQLAVHTLVEGVSDRTVVLCHAAPGSGLFDPNSAGHLRPRGHPPVRRPSRLWRLRAGRARASGRVRSRPPTTWRRCSSQLGVGPVGRGGVVGRWPCRAGSGRVASRSGGTGRRRGHARARRRGAVDSGRATSGPGSVARHGTRERCMRR